MALLHDYITSISEPIQCVVVNHRMAGVARCLDEREQANLPPRFRSLQMSHLLPLRDTLVNTWCELIVSINARHTGFSFPRSFYIASITAFESEILVVGQILVQIRLCTWDMGLLNRLSIVI